MNIRWKNKPKATGLASVCAGPQGSKLHNGKTTLAWTSYINGDFHNVKGWYWVSPSNDELGIELRNSCNEPVETQQEAKAQAKAYIDSCIKQLRGE